jgi:glutaredoxin
MKIRIIGVEGCKNCKKLIQTYNSLKVDFEYWDGERDDLQKQLDIMKVFDFPVIQIVDDKGKILWASDPIVQPKGVSYEKVKMIMKKLS